MAFQIIDDKQGCYGVYTNGQFIYDRVPSNLRGTWAWSYHLPSSDYDYAFLWSGGKTLTEACPEALKSRLSLYEKKIKAHTLNQIKLVESFERNDMVFAIGPAGTGKTYTGIAIAVKALKSKIVKRIILTRPAVEAGEKLGFLPGDLKDKLDPYMQPLYDALKEMIPVEKLEDYIKRGIIEIAPLAYMRGRTLDNAFVILDEGQNTTHNQMKMFLTRMGKSAKFMITGDPGQIDLPRSAISGLKEANIILQNIEGIDIVYLDDKDVIRHKVVKKIIEAYKKTEHAN